jgi:hypothetical protein
MLLDDEDSFLSEQDDVFIAEHEHGGFWEGSVFEAEQWKISTHWTAEQGLTFSVEGDVDNAIAAGEAPKVAAALADLAAMAATNDV